jgi:hypothetical protein
LLAHDQWFSPGTLLCSTTKTDRHDIAEILLKVALKTLKITFTITWKAFESTVVMIFVVNRY